MRQGWHCTMTFRAGRDCGVYSEGDFNLGFAEPQQSEQALRGRGRGWSELPYYFYLGCPSWHHPEWFTIFLFYLYFTIYLFHIWLLPYEYQTALWSDLNVKSRSKKLLSLKKNVIQSNSNIHSASKEKAEQKEYILNVHQDIFKIHYSESLPFSIPSTEMAAAS